MLGGRLKVANPICVIQMTYDKPYIRIQQLSNALYKDLIKLHVAIS